MQPGNNYRAGASLLQDALDQAPTGETMQNVADAMNANGGAFSGYSVPLVWSEMLTVWRKLHVEADSMNAEPLTVAGRGPDWTDIYVTDVITNEGTTTLDLGFGMTGSSPHQYEGGTLTINTPGLTFNVRDNNKDDRWVEVYGVLTQEEIDLILEYHYGVLEDGDPDSGLLPQLYTMGNFIKNAYNDAYIDIGNLEDTHNPNRYVDFILYLTTDRMISGPGWNNSKDLYSSTDFWVSHVVAAYQAGTATFLAPVGNRDNDPDPLVDNSTYPMGPYWEGDGYEETLFTGTTVRIGDWESILFRATIVDFPMYDDFESQTIAHENGHSGGNTGSESEHHSEGGLMSGSLTQEIGRFAAPTLKRFREAQKW